MKKFIPTVICAALLCLLIYPLADDDTIDAANQVEYTEFYDAAVSPMETEIAVDNSVQEPEAEVDVDTTSDETSETETEELPAPLPPLNSASVEIEAPAVEPEPETVEAPAEEVETTDAEAAAVEDETKITTEDVSVEETEATSEVETTPEVSTTETTEAAPMVGTAKEETPVAEVKKPHNPAYYEVGTPSGSPADHNILCASDDLSRMDHIEAYAEMLPDEVWALFLSRGWQVVVIDDVAAATGYDHHILGLCSYKTCQITIENSANGESGIVHEIGHFVDEFHAGYHYGQKASSSEEFAAIWAEEGKTMGQLILTGPANYTTPLEFFAECVRCYFLYNDDLKASCPQAYAYVERVFNEFVANVHAEIEAAEVAEAALSDAETAETEATTPVSEVEWPELTDPDFED